MSTGKNLPSAMQAAGALASVILLSVDWAVAQTPQLAVLDIEIENAVRYFADVTDPARLAMDPGPAAPTPTRAFTDTIFVGDIVAINGKPAKGLWTSRQYFMGFNPNPSPGSAVADVTQGTIAECKYEIQNADGAFIGRLADTGLFPHAVTGGTGAFLGAGGQQAGLPPRVAKPIRAASMIEDPARRRANGGGNTRILIHLLPASRPEILAVGEGLAITHAEGFELVTPANPARAGEILTLYATGLGPTTPAVPLGQSFPEGVLHRVNAPVEVTVGGQAAEVLYAGGYPGTPDTYQVNFRAPEGLPAGATALQLTAAWIPGAQVTIPVRAVPGGAQNQ